MASNLNLFEGDEGLLVDKENLVGRFTGWMKSRNLSLETVKSYIFEAKVFLRFLDSTGTDILKVQKSDILDYLAHLAHEGNAAKTRNRTVYALRSLFTYLMDYDYIESNPTLGIRRSKTEKNKQPTYLEQEELDELFSLEAGYKYHNRNMLIIALMSYMGLRVGEVVRLNLKDIDRATNTLAVLGKGNAWRYLPIQEDLMVLIDSYLQERIEPVKEGDGSSPLFVSQFKRRMSRRSMQHLATLLFEALRDKFSSLKDMRLSAHKLRHTFATHQVREGTDIMTLKSLLGHADIATTSIYVHTNKQQMVEAMGRVKVSSKLRGKTD